MKFSISHNQRTWEPAQDELVIQSVVEESIEADEAGFAAIFFPEHHFQGYSPTGADAFAVMTHLAPLLKNAWLGTAVCTVPNHHPVHLVEMMNMVDQLTKGKVLFSLGSGIHVAEGLGFGLDFQYQTSKMLEENFAIMERLWDKQPEDPPVSFETPVYKGVVLERIVPAPYRKTRPYFMGVANREHSIQRAAKKGWPAWAFGFENWNNLRKYREALVAANHPPEVVAHCMQWTSDVYQGIFVADTDEEAKADMITVMTGHERFNERQWPFIRAAEKIANLPEKAVRMRPPANDERYYNRFCLWGSPDTISRRLQLYVDAGIGNLLISFNNGLYEPERRRIGRKSFDLFIKEVMPRFKDTAPPRDPLAIDLSGKRSTDLPYASYGQA